MTRRAGLAVAVAAFASAGATQAAPRVPPGLAPALTGAYPVAKAAAGADPGSPEGAQARYDTARDLENALPAAANASCRPLLAALRSYARAQIRAAEAYDRIRPAARASAIADADRAAARVDRVRNACRGGDVRIPAEPAILEPADGQVFTRIVRVVAPVGATRLTVVTDGRVRKELGVTGGKTARIRLDGDTGERIDLLELRFRSASGGGRGIARVQNLVRLPTAALAPLRTLRRDPALDTRLATLARGFDGYSGIWIADLATGRMGSVDATALFPAASTVKLGVIAAALLRYRAERARELVRYDLDRIGAWSSNLAANRLYRLLGRERVETALRALGARDSTYPGEYRAGTSRHAVPPLVSQRVTTARDLASMLVTVQRVATGDAAAARRSRLRPADARLVLGILARSQPTGDNAGLFEPFLPAGWTSASKHGWLNAARHSAQLIYGPGGPVLAVCLTYREPLTLAHAQRLGRRVAALAVTLASR